MVNIKRTTVQRVFVDGSGSDGHANWYEMNEIEKKRRAHEAALANRRRSWQEYYAATSRALLFGACICCEIFAFIEIICGFRLAAIRGTYLINVWSVFFKFFCMLLLNS
jgi:hypothetical protein